MNLNFNPLETNLVNLAIVIGVLFWFLRGFLGGILERRRSAILQDLQDAEARLKTCLLYTSPSPRDRTRSRMPSSA